MIKLYLNIYKLAFINSYINKKKSSFYGKKSRKNARNCPIFENLL